VLDTNCGDPFAHHGHACIDSTHETYSSWQRIDSAYPLYEVAQIETILTPDSLYLCHEYELTFGSYRSVSEWQALAADYFDTESIRHESRALRSLGVNYQSEHVAVCSDDVFEWAGLSSTHQHARSLVWSRMYWRSFMSPLIDLKVPMAWQITMGAPSVYTAVADPTNGGPEHGTEVSHPDLTYAPAGNFFYLPPQQDKPSRTKRLTPGNRHANVAMGLTVGQFNDVGIVGLAPKSRIVAVLANDRVHEFPDSHVPLHVNPSWVLKHPQIVTNPHETGSDKHVKDVASSGSIVIGSVSNHPGEVFDVSDPNNVTTYMGAVCAQPGNAVWSDPSNSISEADVQVLTIGGYSWNAVNKPDEAKQSSDYQGWGWLDDCTPQVNPFVNVVMQDHNFGCFHATKFPPSTLTRTERLASKSLAPLDVVAPNVALGIDFHPAAHQPRYTTLEQGNSQNQHYGAGIAALMMSVKDRFALQGMAVQRRFYNIVTFTADKLLDPIPSQSVGSDPTVFPSDHMHPSLLTTGSPKKLNTVYRAQPNDHLDRYWAIRMGFGRLNAFRSVAHSIPGVGANNQPNVKYTYAGTDNLDWANAHEMNGNNGLGTVKYLHLGKYINATDLVLEHGGVKFEGEPDYLNSNGKTIINKNLSVGNAQGLVVDGIVDTDVTDNTQYPAITTTSESGRILITGWLRRVRLDGRIYAVDLRVVNDGAGEAPKLVCRGGQSELHDTLWLRNNTKLVVEEGGTLDLMPGAIVIMSQGSSITVKSGGKVNLHHAVRIVPAATYTTNQPIVSLEGGGEMATVYRYDDEAERVAEQSENIVIETRLSLNANSTLRVKQCVDFVYPSLDVYVITADAAANIILEPNAYLRQRNQATSGVAGGIRIPTLVAPTGGAPARYRVDVPTTIPAGPLVVVPAGTNLELGRVKVEYNGGVYVGPGATLTLLEREVEWNGKLHVHGTSGNRATVRGAMEQLTLCGAAEASRRAWPTLLKMIPGEFPYKDLNYNDSRAITAKLGCYLLLDWARMENVFTRTTSMPILGHNGTEIAMGFVSNTEFRADRDKIHEALATNTERERFVENSSHMLDVQRPHSALTPLRNFRKDQTSDPEEKGKWNVAHMRLRRDLGSLRVDNSMFRDDAGPVQLDATDRFDRYEHYQTETWYGEGDEGTRPYYALSGVKSKEMQTVAIASCGFANLKTGVETVNDAQLVVTESHFGNMQEGIIGTGVTVCASEFTRANIGVSVRPHGVANFIDCKFGAPMDDESNGAMTYPEAVVQIGSGITVEDAKVFVRSCTFQDCNVGIGAKETSVAELRDYRTCRTSACNDIAIWGRNRFRGIEISSDKTPYRKAKIHVSDLFFDGTGPKFLVRCGLNDHSGQIAETRHSNYHHEPTGDDPTTTTIDPNVNEFNTGQLPRVVHVVFNPALTVRDKATITDNCETGDKLRAAVPEVECVPALPPPSSGSWWGRYLDGSLPEIPAWVHDIVRPARVQPDVYSPEDAAERLIVSNHYWRYAGAPTGNRVEWLHHHMELLMLDTLYPTNTDAVLVAMTTVVADTNQDIQMRRVVLPTAVKLLYERDNCSAAVTLYSTMMAVLYSQEERDAMYFADVPLWQCNMDSLSTDSLAVLYNAELVRYLDRDYVPDTLEKRAWRDAEATLAKGANVQMSVVPNPASDAVNLCVSALDAALITYKIKVTSLLGTDVFSHSGVVTRSNPECIVAATAHLPRGMYVVRVESMTSSVATMLVLH